MQRTAVGRCRRPAAAQLQEARAVVSSSHMGAFRLPRGALLIGLVVVLCLGPAAAQLNANVQSATITTDATYTWQTTSQVTPSPVTSPVTGSVTAQLRITATRTQAPGAIFRVSAQMLIGNPTGQAYTLNSVRGTIAGQDTGTSCGGSIPMSAGQTVTCTITGTTTQTGTIFIGGNIQYQIQNTGGVVSYQVPDGSRAQLDTSRATVDKTEARCANVALTWNPAGAGTVLPTASGDLPSTTGTQACDTRTWSGNLVFANFNASGPFTEGPTPGSCQPGVQAVGRVVTTPDQRGADTQPLNVPVTLTGCSSSLTVTLAGLQFAPATTSASAWTLGTTVTPATISIGGTQAATFLLNVTRAANLGGTLTGNVTVQNTGAVPATLDRVTIVNGTTTIGTVTCPTTAIAPGTSLSCPVSITVPAEQGVLMSNGLVAVGRTTTGSEARSAAVVPTASTSATCPTLTDTLVVDGTGAPSGWTPAAAREQPKETRICGTQTVTYTTAFTGTPNNAGCGPSVSWKVVNRPVLTLPGGDKINAATAASITVNYPCTGTSTAPGATATPAPAPAPAPAPTPGPGASPTPGSSPSPAPNASPKPGASPAPAPAPTASPSPSASPAPAAAPKAALGASFVGITSDNTVGDVWNVDIVTTPSAEVTLVSGVFSAAALSTVKYNVRYRKSDGAQQTVAGSVAVNNTGDAPVTIRGVKVTLGSGTADANCLDSSLAAGKSTSCTFTIPYVPGQQMTAVVTPGSGSTVNVGPQAVPTPPEKPTGTASPCATVFLDFPEGTSNSGTENSGEDVTFWPPNSIVGLRPPSLEAVTTGTARVTASNRICATKEYNFTASVGPWGDRTCGTQYVVLARASVVPSQENRPLVTKDNRLAVVPSECPDPNAPGASRATSTTGTRTPAPATRPRRSDRIVVKIVQPTERAVQAVNWALSSAPVDLSSDIPVNESSKVTFDLTVTQSTVTTYIITGVVELDNKGRQDIKARRVQVTFGSEAVKASCPPNVLIPGELSVTCAFRLTSRRYAGNLTAVVTLSDGSTASGKLLLGAGRAPPKPAAAPTAACAELLTGTVIGAPLIVPAASAGSAAATPAPAAEGAAPVVVAPGQRLQVCGSRAFRVEAPIPAKNTARCRSSSVEFAADLLLPPSPGGAAVQRITTNSAASLNVVGCSFDAATVEGSFSDIFGIDLSARRYSLRTTVEELSAVVTDTYTWSNTLTVNATGPLRQPYSRPFGLNYTGRLVKSASKSTTVLTGKVRLQMATVSYFLDTDSSSSSSSSSSGGRGGGDDSDGGNLLRRLRQAAKPAATRQNLQEKWPSSVKMLISDTSGAVMTVPVTCTPPLATTSMDRPVTCTFKAEGVNARAMYPGTPMLLMQPLVGAGAAGAGEPMPTTTVGPVSSAATKPTELRALGNCTEYAVTWRGVQVAPAAANRTAPSSSSSSVQIVPVGTAPKGETCATADVRFAVKATPTGGRNACREATEVRTTLSATPQQATKPVAATAVTTVLITGCPR